MKDSSVSRIPAHTCQTGAALLIAAVTMMLTAITSLIVVRQASAPDWGRVRLPLAFYALIAVSVFSSLTLEAGKRRRFASAFQATLALGAACALMLAYVWNRLFVAGFRLNSSPAVSAFFLLTGIYAALLLSEIAALGYLMIRFEKSTPKFSPVLDAIRFHWHFTSVVSIYILVLLNKG
jgi:heme/copper-type cytochrome/quinol oxidase subunit 3